LEGAKPGPGPGERSRDGPGRPLGRGLPLRRLRRGAAAGAAAPVLAPPSRSQAEARSRLSTQPPGSPRRSCRSWARGARRLRRPAAPKGFERGTKSSCRGPGTPEDRKPEILLRLAELSYREEEAALRSAYEAAEEPKTLPEARYADSIRYYQRLVEAYPGSAQALTGFYNLGYLYAETGRGFGPYRPTARPSGGTPRLPTRTRSTCGSARPRSRREPSTRRSSTTSSS